MRPYKPSVQDLRVLERITKCRSPLTVQEIQMVLWGVNQLRTRCSEEFLGAFLHYDMPKEVRVRRRQLRFYDWLYGAVQDLLNKAVDKSRRRKLKRPILMMKPGILRAKR